MSLNIEALIQKKPHLEGPFRLYGKILEFTKAARELFVPMDAGPGAIALKAYPPDSVEPILRHFASIIGMPDDSLTPLQQALELEEIDFTRLPFHEVPAFSLPYPEEDLGTLLFILSKPYFLSLKDASGLHPGTWKEGRCPVCHAKPSLSSLDQEQARRLSCSFCAMTGEFDRIRCPLCLNSDISRMNMVTFDGEEGFSIYTCDACGSYLKSVEAGMLAGMTPDIADLLSLPMDIVMQEKGYVRHSPNPIGLVRMI